MKKFTLLFAALLLTAPVVSLADSVAGCASEGDNWWSEERAIMGTEVRVELWHIQQAEACAAIEDVMLELERIEQAMSPFLPTSLLTQLNENAARRPVTVGEELYNLIARSVEFSAMTDGAFDVTYASAGRFYDYRKKVSPDADALAQVIDAIDYKHLEFNSRKYSIRYLNENVYVDLGGIAKGYAVDRGIEVLISKGFTQAVVAAGGDSRILGDRQGEPWIVGIRDPRKEDTMVAVLPLVDISVSTSGDYERYFERDGVRYHHIIDPDTGDSARDVRSVTILGDQAVMTDALSTSVFVLGTMRGLELINRMKDVDAIVVDGNGVMHVSNSLLEMVATK
ncbi:MAG: FAD:protein FMN transferase [bacterium]|nr:FAD:protein FMN transferase [Gammaproteobacteria bacterium]